LRVCYRLLSGCDRKGIKSPVQTRKDSAT